MTLTIVVELMYNRMFENLLIVDSCHKEVFAVVETQYDTVVHT